MNKSPVASGFKPTISLSLMDKAVSFFSPKKGLQRVQSKMAMSALGSSGYITPGKTKRSMLSWFVSGGSADSDTLNDLTSSRAGSRDLYMNTPIATGAIRRLRTNVTGYGLSFQSRIDKEYLNLTDEQTTKWERDVEREFKLWSTSVNCDITRTNTFSQLQSLAFISYLLSGDVFSNLPYKAVKGFPYKLRVQLIEGDQVSNPDSSTGIGLTDKIRGGIEVDENGAPTKYYVRSKHPGDSTISMDWKAIDAFGAKSGRKNILHIFSKERPGQRRGMPFLAPILEQLKQLTRLSEAELMGAIVASFFTVFIKNLPGSGRMDEGFVPAGTTDASADDTLIRDTSTDVGDKTYEMRSGNIITLDENEEIDIADPKRPNAAFEPFFNSIVKQLGAAIEIPFEVLLQHFSSSYSASRAAMLEAWKTIMMYRENFNTDFNQPVFEAFLTEAVTSGRIQAPGFLTDPLAKLAWCGSRWSGPTQGQIDPMKETKASILKIRNHLSTREDESQSNVSWDSIAERLRREQDTLEEKGLLTEESNSTEDFNADTSVENGSDADLDSDVSET